MHVLYEKEQRNQPYIHNISKKARKKMRGMKVSFAWVILLVLMGGGGVWEVVRVANGDTGPAECKEEKRLLVNACRPVIFGLNPSASCCQRVRVTHVECVCPSLSPKVASLIGSVQRRVKQIESCGRTVPRNFKCGSVTTPP